VRPNRAAVFIFVAHDVGEHIDVGDEVMSMLEKIGAKHVYSRPSEIPEELQHLWDPGKEPPRQFGCFITPTDAVQILGASESLPFDLWQRLFEAAEAVGLAGSVDNSEGDQNGMG
jgi:hypothetical protein